MTPSAYAGYLCKAVCTYIVMPYLLTAHTIAC